MLRVLLASQPVRAGWLGGTTFSTATHGALIALAVVTSGTAVSTVHEERASAAPERVTYVEPARMLDALRMARSNARAVAPHTAPRDAARAVAAEVAALQRSVSDVADAIKPPDVAAAVDLTAVADAWLARPDGLSSQPTSLAGLLAEKSGFVAPANGIYTADLVEKSVEPKRGNPKPRYPSALADMGIEGTFVVRFVVDSTGSVPADRIEFPGAMHRLFAAAVRTALLKSHYLPAMVGGRTVPEEVVQEFRFQVGRR